MPTATDIWLAEHLSVDCNASWTVNGFEMICIKGKVSMNGQVHFPHETCGGTGKLWLLRKPCRADDHNEHGQCSSERYDEGVGLNFYVEVCDGRGWLPDISYDTLKAAARAQGWSITIETRDKGDFVCIYDTEGDEIGRCFSSVRDTAAVTLAMARAAGMPE